MKKIRKKIFAFTFSLLLLLSGMLIVGINETTAEENIEMKEENGAFFDPKIIDHTEEVELGDEIKIKYSVTNTGNATGTQDIILIVEIEQIDFKEERTHEDVTLGPGDDVTYEYTYDTSEEEEEYGQDFIEIEVEVEVTLKTDDASDSAKSTVTSPGMIPGFTLILLVIGVTFAVMIYQKKKR